MVPLNFMHSIFVANIEDVNSLIHDYIESSGKKIWVNNHFGLMVYEYIDWKFTWWYFPRDFLGFVDDDDVIESEILTESIHDNQKEFTEVRISFTEEPLLDDYFADLAYLLFQTFPVKREGINFHLECLPGKPVFYSPVDYAKANAIALQKAGEDLLTILPEKKKRKSGGKSNFTETCQLEVIKKWDNGFEGKESTKLPDFLIKEFGESEGIPNVPEQTFYSWRKRLIDRGKYHPK
jgi:hypothetical protein